MQNDTESAERHQKTPSLKNIIKQNLQEQKNKTTLKIVYNSYMIFCKTFVGKTENLFHELPKIDFEKSIFININNNAYLIMEKFDNKISVRIFDVLEHEAINICLNRNHFFYWGKLIEKCVDYNNKIKFLGHGRKIKGKYNIEQKEKIISLYNILGPNFNNYKKIEDLNLSFPIVNEEYTLIKQEEQRGLSLDNIIKNLGYPHHIITLPGGVHLLFYFGFHKCKKGSSTGVMLLKINKLMDLEGKYTMILDCDCGKESEIKSETSCF